MRKQPEENNLFNKWFCNSWIFTRNKCPLFIPCLTHKSYKMDHKPKTIKCLGVIEENLCDLKLDKDFLHTIPKAQSTQEKKLINWASS